MLVDCCRCPLGENVAEGVGVVGGVVLFWDLAGWLNVDLEEGVVWRVCVVLLAAAGVLGVS